MISHLGNSVETAVIRINTLQSIQQPPRPEFSFHGKCQNASDYLLPRTIFQRVSKFKLLWELISQNLKNNKILEEIIRKVVITYNLVYEEKCVSINCKTEALLHDNLTWNPIYSRNNIYSPNYIYSRTIY